MGVCITDTIDKISMRGLKFEFIEGWDNISSSEGFTALHNVLSYAKLVSQMTSKTLGLSSMLKATSRAKLTGLLIIAVSWV